MTWRIYILVVYLLVRFCFVDVCYAVLNILASHSEAVLDASIVGQSFTNSGTGGLVSVISSYRFCI